MLLILLILHVDLLVDSGIVMALNLLVREVGAYLHDLLCFAETFLELDCFEIPRVVAVVLTEVLFEAFCIPT